MRFVVHAAALNGADSVLDLIDRLVDRHADEVHRVEVQDLDRLLESKWYRKGRPTRQKVLKTAATKPPRATNDRRGPHVKTVEVLDLESARLADRLAHTPLKILVEDRESDGVFLDIVVDELGWPELQRLWVRSKTVTPCAVEPDTAGGKGSIPQRVARESDDATKQSRPIRLFVLRDGDARWPGDEKEARALAALRGLCARYGVPLHVLAKRCAENYIPDSVFEAVREDPRNLNHVDRFNALLQRSRVQRDHFPVKDGMDDAELSGAIQAGLYGPSEVKDLELLKRPLLPGRPRPFLLLEKERRVAFTAEGLRERDGEGELDALLVAIAKEL